ncbi:MAG: DUF4843 domain-containing protein [Chitinophaga sp.]|uniref:DUF4843 domain-containing protein n=1 Tax=Chitinophaga sp. TaxID=1869181 RepID=UPI0025B7EF28|nr:DUF4843 domain-containing protein [Chitinophaga sp.]MBV8251585.1 DUF4843 domain-containing protein [Chitinophaga sp.]
MMYRKLSAVAILFLLFVVAGCRKEQLARFTAQDAVYFSQSSRDSVAVYYPLADGTYDTHWTLYNADTTRRLDTIVNVIGGAPEATKEVVLSVRVLLQGNVANRDRKFKLVIDQQTSTIPMDAVTMKEEDCVLKAGRSVAFVPVKIKRLPVMASKPLYLTVKLESAGDNLSVDYGSRMVSRNKKDILVRTFGIYDNVPKPMWWTGLGDSYLGKFSRTKYKFIQDYFGVTSDYLQAQPSSPYMIIAWGQRLYCVFNALSAAGKTVMDYDDVTGAASPMTSGNSSKNSCIEDLP